MKAGWTRWASYAATGLAVAFLVAMALSLLVESLPVWRDQGEISEDITRE